MNGLAGSRGIVAGIGGCPGTGDAVGSGTAPICGNIGKSQGESASTFIACCCYGKVWRGWAIYRCRCWQSCNHRCGNILDMNGLAGSRGIVAGIGGCPGAGDAVGSGTAPICGNIGKSQCKRASTFIACCCYGKVCRGWAIYRCCGWQRRNHRCGNILNGNGLAGRYRNIATSICSCPCSGHTI